MTSKKQPFPIVRVVGILSACAITLLGIVAGLAPDVILVRVIVATVSIMVIVALAHKLILLTIS